MSRIYEALLKAESERMTGQTATEPSQTESPETVKPRPMATVSEIHPGLDLGLDRDLDRQRDNFRPVLSSGLHLDLMPESDAIDDIYGIPSGPPEEDRLNMNAVRKVAWTPSLAQLPSLMDRGVAVEQFRSLRSRIFEMRDIKPLKSILVSSGLPQEGKSFVATNLAISLARHKNAKVLLIDGDMRRYTLHQLLGCEPYPGLADYLAGKTEIVDVMQQAQETPDQSKDGGKAGSIAIGNLTFIAGGNGGDKAADLSGNPRFAELIRRVSPYFDWIIVDSSPVIPVSDAVNLARACDGVLLVARGGVTKYPVAQKAQSELKASNILGFVLNAVVKQTRSTGYDGYNGYNGYDGYDSETK
jgi:protein-tyrosine kinase